MGEWLGMTACNLLIPVIMIAAGWMMEKHPPKTINGLYGYRTSRSMKNMDTWRFANTYSGKLWRKIGWIMLPISVVPMLFIMGKGSGVIGGASCVVILLQTAVLVASIIPVEKALKRTFDQYGRRREGEE